MTMAFRLRVFGAFVLSTTLSCGDDSLTPPSRVLSLDGDGYSIELDVNAVTISLKRGDEVLTTIDGEGLSLGTVDTIDDLVNYDPYPIVAQVEGYFPPAGAAFHGAVKVTSATEQDGAIVAELLHQGGSTSRLTISVSGQGSFSLALVPNDASRVAWLRVGTSAAEAEAFYGLGEHFDDVNQRGKIRAMQMVVDSLESANNEAHVPVPLVIGTAGWGLFAETSYTGVFDVAATDVRGARPPHEHRRLERIFGLR